MKHRGILLGLFGAFLTTFMGWGATAQADAKMGEAIFSTMCIACHPKPGTDDAHFKARAGVGLRGVYGGESSIGLGLMTEERLKTFITNPKSLKPDTQMVGMPLDPTGLQDVVDYLATLEDPDTVGVPHQIRVCMRCHNTDATMKKKVGPPLFGVFGRAPSIEGVPFKLWDEAALNSWISDPAKVKPQTKMKFPGFDNPTDRKVVIDYLKTLK